MINATEEEFKSRVFDRDSNVFIEEDSKTMTFELSFERSLMVPEGMIKISDLEPWMRTA